MADSTKISSTLRPPCSRCGKPTILKRNEPEEPGFGLRIFYCASCAACDRVIATADVNDGSLGPLQAVVSGRKGSANGISLGEAP
jgi:hypothetical protein